MYDGLLEALMSGDTSIPCPELQERYKQLKEVDPETKKSKLQDQFEVSFWNFCIFLKKIWDISPVCGATDNPGISVVYIIILLDSF